jgi:hypothetical protein
VLVGAPFWESSPGEKDEGAVFAYYGNGVDGLERPVQQLREDGRLIALLGQSDSANSFGLRVVGRTPAGRSRVRLEWEVKPVGVAFDGTGLVRSGFFDTGAPGAEGSKVVINEVAAGLDLCKAYHWRVRILSESPYFPRSSWMSMAGNGPGETDLRSGGGFRIVSPAPAENRPVR